jgi:hypothetical protein
VQERAGSVQGRIKIPPELRVVGSTPTFVLGDMSGLDENKMAWHIASQVETRLTTSQRYWLASIG